MSKQKPAAASPAAAPARRSAGELLADARQALAETQAAIAELEGERNARLLDDDDSGALRIEDALAERRKTAARQADKVKLLEVEAKRAAEEAELARREKVIARTEARLREADKLGEDLEISLKVCVGTFQRLVALREECRAVFLLGNSHENASMNAAEGCALSGASISTLISHELFRLNPPHHAGGVPGIARAARFPGDVCPQIQLQYQPERIPSLSHRLKKASAFTIELLRARPRTIELGDEAVPAPVPAELVPVNGAAHDAGPAEETRLNKLLKRQMELAKDTSPEGEAEYMKIVGELAALTAGA